MPTYILVDTINLSNIMYQQLYKRSAEKWQKVAILQKTQKVYILSGPLWYTLTEKPDSRYAFRNLFIMSLSINT